MKIAMLSPSLSRSAGGIFEIERSVAVALHRMDGVEVEAIGFNDANWSEDSSAWGEVRAQCFPYVGPAAFRYSRQLRNRVFASDADIVHLQALWMYTSIVASKWTWRTKRPLVVTPNGMLEPWALSNSSIKKRLAMLMYEGRLLRRAAILQANTQKELGDFRRLGLDNPVAVIPNGVDLPHLTMTDPKERAADRPPYMLFLGRLHPKKGLRELIAGWAALSPAERGGWLLKIAGWDDGGHEIQLKALAQSSGNAAGIEFVGPVFGDAKRQLLKGASAFVLPSFSEGLPIAVLEAWSYALPVLMTDHCNLEDGFDAGAALRVEPSQPSIKVALRDFFALSDQALHAMGVAGRRLVEKKYTWRQVAQEIHAVYDWLLNSGPQPACVCN